MPVAQVISDIHFEAHPDQGSAFWEHQKHHAPILRHPSLFLERDFPLTYFTMDVPIFWFSLVWIALINLMCDMDSPLSVIFCSHNNMSQNHVHVVLC